MESAKLRATVVLVGFAFLLAAQFADLAHAATGAAALPLLKLALFGIFVIAAGISAARLRHAR